MCIRCGREVDRLVDGRLCPSCYLELHGLGKPPERLSIVVCPRCGSYRYQGRWLPPPGGGLEEVAALLFQASFRPSEHTEYYRVEEASIDYETGRAVVRAAGRLRGVDEEVSVVYTVPIVVRKQLCPVCFQKAAGSPAAIVQVRGPGGRLSEEEREAVEDVMSELDDYIADAILSVDELREGIDLKLLDQNAARALAAKLRSKLAARVKESHKVVGRRNDGRRVSRLTLSVRLPFFKPGNIVEYQGELARVEEIDKGYVLIRRLGGRRLHRLTVEDAWRLLSEPRLDDHRRVMVVALEPGWVHLQYLDGGYEYLEIPRSGLRVEGELREGVEAELLIHKNHYYLIPRRE
ncbi:hypothetical protein CF15_06675 [Pyrodictium occultum]|uniref:Nmd3 N-terminal domain-containing protein n=2 Tax=Pyrodictium occultum TaxID=2309 RepID=A0A0V8RWG9_PYROC|nr:hypothetical protein CF15_06675 [Pyrodictium occultum]